MISAYTKYRSLEALPALLAICTLLGGFIITLVNPITMIYVIIVFDFYWMVKIIYLSSYLVVSYRSYKEVMETDWSHRCATQPLYPKIYHLVFIPNSSEHIEVVEATLAALSKTTFPKERIIVVLAAEERYPKSIQNGYIIKKKYGHLFHTIEVSIHPANVVGEIAGKGANLAWAGKHIKAAVIDKLRVSYEHIIVSILDVDTCLEAQYFSYLTYVYLTQPNPTRASYQPIPMFSNNIWDAPAIIRVAAIGTTFWLMSEQVRPERLLTFSSHSMPFKALVDVGWWQTDAVSDDSRIFLQCFLEYNGDYAVVPLHMPVYMDTVLSDSWWKSLKNLYKQQRRWAYGSENIPYMIWHFWNTNCIPLRKRLYHILNQIEGMWSWGTAPLVIFIFGYLPRYLLTSSENATVIAQTAPLVLEWMLRVANVGLILSIVLGTLLLPRRPVKYPASKYLMMLLQWAFLPVSIIAFGSIPAIDAQVRLALGKYLGFYITEKARKIS